MINIDPNEEYPLEDIADYVAVRDDYLCQKCGKRGYQRHHILPKSMGGSDCTNNLILLCGHCHDYIEHVPFVYAYEFEEIVKKNEQKLRKSLVE